MVILELIYLRVKKQKEKDTKRKEMQQWRGWRESGGGGENAADIRGIRFQKMLLNAHERKSG